MKRYRYILSLILIFTFGNSYAHQDFWIIEDFGNVKVRIKTGFRYEEIQKVFLFGQLAEQLAKQLNYSEQIFLDFNHYYVRNCEPDYFISYDKGKIQSTYEKEFFLKEKSIVIRQVARQFDAQTTLKLLEYAILNIQDIKSSQKEIEYRKNYCEWIINSIDTAFIKKMLNEPNSNQINNVLSLKIKKPFKDYVSYYLQNNKYTVCVKYNKIDTALITLDNVYQFYEGRKSLVFDTDTSFYYISGFDKKVSERHIIQNTDNYWQPYIINYIGNEKLSIYLSRSHLFGRKDRTLLYLMDKDILIQDLDELINDKVHNQNE